jgi:stage III sporulation protein AG
LKFLDSLSGKKKSLILALAGIIGLMLIIFGTFGEKKDEKDDVSKNSKENVSTMEYIQALENKIGNIAEQITGSGNVRVIVSVSSGTEYIYVSNEKLGENSSSKEYITVRTESGADELILFKEIYPEVTGVSVACKGGDSPEIQAKLIAVISTSLNVGSNRICIVGIK